MSDPQEIAKKKLFKKYAENPPASKEELKNWILVFLGLDLPDSHLPDADSNASPMEALWVAFDDYRNNRGDQSPGYIWLSSRDAFKTLSASILAVCLMMFFDATICWLASIEPQSKIALNNVQSFILKLTPYLGEIGSRVESNNARNLEIVQSDGNRSHINILVATLASVNGKHVNVVFSDEVDLIKDTRVLDEVQAVASLIGAQFPLKLYFSTRKFAFGAMENLIQKKETFGLKLLKWDIMDVTEHCSKQRRKSDFKSAKIYIHPDPPLRSVTIEDYANLPSSEAKQYELVDVYAGCVSCKLVSQCKTRLAERSPLDKGKLWKKIEHTVNMFRSMSPDMAIAQLLCRKPSLSGLIYPRFEESSNSMTLDQAFYNFTGEEKTGVTIKDLTAELKRQGIPIYASGDWGHSGGQAFVVHAMMPAGEWWILDAWSIPNLEFDDILQLGITIRDEYDPKAWYMDTNQPMFIKTFRKNGMSCRDFTKDVQGGIECVRGQIVNASGRRALKVIKHERTDVVMQMFHKHHFKLDSLGKPTETPDDEELSHIGDSVRYFAQNMFGKNAVKPVISVAENPKPKFEGSDLSKAADFHNKNMMLDEVRRFAPQAEVGAQPSGTIDRKGKKVFWDLG
jgi:hypothetical protein